MEMASYFFREGRQAEKKNDFKEAAWNYKEGLTFAPYNSKLTDALDRVSSKN